MEPYEAVLIALSIIAGAGGASAVIWRIARPHLEKFVAAEIKPLAARMVAAEEAIDDLADKKERDYARLNKLQSQQRTMLKALFALLSNARTNNSTGLMDEAMSALQNALIED
jgi:predicted negative regulator of RcsB-dependent stress response